MAQVGPASSFGVADTANLFEDKNYYDKGGLPSASNGDYAVIKVVVFLYDLVSGKYSEDIDQGIDKAFGFFVVTWKLLMLILVCLFVVWWFRKKWALEKYYREQNKNK